MTVVTTGDEQAKAAQHDSPRPRDATEATSGDAAQELGFEAARLAEAFSEWAGARSPATGSAEDQMAGSGSDSEAPGTESFEGSGGPADSGGEAGARGGATCDCGSNSGADAICRVCPICRVAAYVQTVRPEVLERVGDVLAMVAGSLQAMAAERSSEQTEHRTPAGTPGAPESPFRDADEAASGASEAPEPSVIPIQVYGDDFPSQTGGAV